MQFGGGAAGTRDSAANLAQKRNMTEQDPFTMSESASIVPGSDQGSNLLSSHMGSSYQAS